MYQNQKYSTNRKIVLNGLFGIVFELELPCHDKHTFLIHFSKFLNYLLLRFDSLGVIID